MSTDLSLSNSTAVQATSTNYVERHAELFASTYMSPAAEVLAERIPVTTKVLSVNWLAKHPTMAKWLGARPESSFRAYNYTLTVEPYVATAAVKRMDVQADTIGFVGRALDTFLRGAVTAVGDSVITSLITNSGKGPVIYDGVNLMDDDHPHVGTTAGTGSNYSTNNLSHANLDTAVYTGQLLTMENGRNFGINYDTLIVGPKLRVRAQQLLNATRLQTTTNASAFDAGTIVAAGAVPSVWQGDLKLIVDNGITNYYWYLVDSSKVGAKPMAVAMFREPTPLVRDDMKDPRRWSHDEFLYGLEGDWTVGGAVWQALSGQIGTA